MTKIPRLKIPVRTVFLEDISFMPTYLDIGEQNRRTYCFHGSLDFSSNGTENASIRTSEERLNANDIIRWCSDVLHCAFATIMLAISA